MLERLTTNQVEVPKQPALDILHFLGTTEMPNKTQDEVLGFLNGFEATRALTAIMSLHGEPVGPSGSRRIAGQDFDQRFEANLHTNYVAEPDLLRMYAYQPMADNKDTPLYGMTIPLLPDGSLDPRRDIITSWNRQTIVMVRRHPAELINPAPVAWAFQGCVIRLGNSLRAMGPTLAPVESAAAVDEELLAA